MRSLFHNVTEVISFSYASAGMERPHCHKKGVPRNQRKWVPAHNLGKYLTALNRNILAGLLTVQETGIKTIAMEKKCKKKKKISGQCCLIPKMMCGTTIPHGVGWD